MVESSQIIKKGGKMEVLLTLHNAIPSLALVLLIVFLMIALSRWFWRLCRLKNFDIVNSRKACIIFLLFSWVVFGITYSVILSSKFNEGWLMIIGSTGAGFISAAIVFLITDPNLIANSPRELA